MKETPSIYLHQLVSSKPPSEQEKDLLERKLKATLIRGKGKNELFRLEIGDEVEDFGSYVKGYAKPVGKVVKLYRENGHNKVETDSKEKCWFRECDLRRITKESKKGN
jgi:hypothetical protein